MQHKALPSDELKEQERPHHVLQEAAVSVVVWKGLLLP
jgi:hypothetical protein